MALSVVDDVQVGRREGGYAIRDVARVMGLPQIACWHAVAAGDDDEVVRRGADVRALASDVKESRNL